jgi:hypothetical protein
MLSKAYACFHEHTCIVAPVSAAAAWIRTVADCGHGVVVLLPLFLSVLWGVVDTKSFFKCFKLHFIEDIRSTLAPRSCQARQSFEPAAPCLVSPGR